MAICRNVLCLSLIYFWYKNLQHWIFNTTFRLTQAKLHHLSIWILWRLSLLNIILFVSLCCCILSKTMVLKPDLVFEWRTFKGYIGFELCFIYRVTDEASCLFKGFWECFAGIHFLFFSLPPSHSSVYFSLSVRRTYLKMSLPTIFSITWEKNSLKTKISTF